MGLLYWIWTPPQERAEGLGPKDHHLFTFCPLQARMVSIISVPCTVCGIACVIHHYVSNSKLMSELQGPQRIRETQLQNTKSQAWRPSGTRSEYSPEIGHFSPFMRTNKRASEVWALPRPWQCGDHGSWGRLRHYEQCRAEVSARALALIGFGPKSWLSLAPFHC